MGRESANHKPAIVIYTHSLLGGSMTFIKAHAEALVSYAPIYAGAHRINGIDLAPWPAYVVNDGTPLGIVREALFRRWNWAPTLMKRLKAHNPAIVHAHFGTSGPAALAVASSLDVPLVVTFHGYDATMSENSARKSQRGRELLRSKVKLIASAGKIIAVSRYIQQRLLEQGYPEDKVLLVRNGISLDAFRPSPRAVEHVPVILFVGRFIEKKGAQYLIEAAAILQQRGVRFRLVMIGAGPLESELNRAATESAIPVHFTGFLDLHSVKEWLGRACVVAVPSVTARNGDAEGLPTILLEAQASGIPVVATRHSGIPEGVEEGITAELVAERDARGLATALQTFLESPEKSEAYGRAGRRLMENNFDIRRQIRHLEQVYDDLCRDRQRNR